MEQSVARFVALWLREGASMAEAIRRAARHFGMRYADVEECVEFAS